MVATRSLLPTTKLLALICALHIVFCATSAAAPVKGKALDHIKSLDRNSIVLPTSERAGARDTIGRIAERARQLGYAANLVQAIYSTVNHLAHTMQTNQPIDNIIAALRAYSDRAGNLAHWLILNGFIENNAQDSRDSRIMYGSFMNTADQAFNLEATAFGYSSEDRNQWLNWARNFLGHGYNHFPVHDELRRRSR